MSEPSARKEGWSEEGNRISEGEDIEFASGRLCNSWQHFCSCPCPEAREPSAGDFSSDLWKKIHQTKSTKAHGSHWHHSTGTKDCRHLGGSEGNLQLNTIAHQVSEQRWHQTSGFVIFQRKIAKKSRCVKPYKLCANAMSKWACNINDILKCTNTLNFDTSGKSCNKIKQNILPARFEMRLERNLLQHSLW